MNCGSAASLAYGAKLLEDLGKKIGGWYQKHHQIYREVHDGYEYIAVFTLCV